MISKPLLAGIILACGVCLAAVAVFDLGRKPGNVSKVDGPDEQILALEQAYRVMMHERSVSRSAVNPAPKREIIMFTRPKCFWCERWLAVEAPRLRNAGYDIGWSVDHSFPVVPVFEIIDGEKRYQKVGYFEAKSIVAE